MYFIFIFAFSPILLCEAIDPTDLISRAVKLYDNGELMKNQIIQDNLGKSGVYCWVNNQTGDYYIGSSVDLGRRFKEYFSIAYLTNTLNRGNSIICYALLKYGFSFFTMIIPHQSLRIGVVLL